MTCVHAYSVMFYSFETPWSGLPFPTPGDLPKPAMKPSSPVLPALAGGFLIAEAPGKPNYFLFLKKIIYLGCAGS